jgi:hypothetical protein
MQGRPRRLKRGEDASHCFEHGPRHCWPMLLIKNHRSFFTQIKANCEASACVARHLVQCRIVKATASPSFLQHSP